MPPFVIKPIPNSRGSKTEDFLRNHQTCWENWQKVQNQFQTYNVLDYGAKGDGLSDDTAAIQNSIDACAATVGRFGTDTGGGVVLFPPGRYLTGPLLISTPFTSLQGFGSTATEIVSRGTGSSFVKFYGGDSIGNPKHMNSFIRDIKFIQGSDVAWTNFLHLENVSEMDIDNIWIETSENTCSYAVMFESALTINVSKSIVRGAALDAMRIKKRTAYGAGDAYPNAIVIRETAIKSSKRWGISYSDGEGFLIQSCDLSANGKGGADINHGAIYVNDCGNEVGGGLCAVIRDTRFEATVGCHVRVGRHSYAPGGTLIENCTAGGALYGVYSDVAYGERALVIVKNSGFIGSSSKDYYIGDYVGCRIYNCWGVTERLPPGAIAIPLPSNAASSMIESGSLAYIPQVFSTNSSTPAANLGGPPVILSNTSATTITSIPGCKDGNTLTFFSTNGNTTFKHRYTGAGISDEIDCPGGLDYTLDGGDSISFIRMNGHWYPTALMGSGTKFKYIESTYATTITCDTSGTISLSSSYNTLSYIRIGNHVTVLGRVNVTSVSSPVGAVLITLPFAVANGAFTKTALGLAFIENYPNTQCFWKANPGTSYAVLLYNNAGSSTVANAADFSGDEEIHINLTYLV